MNTCQFSVSSEQTAGMSSKKHGNPTKVTRLEIRSVTGAIQAVAWARQPLARARAHCHQDHKLIHVGSEEKEVTGERVLAVAREMLNFHSCPSSPPCCLPDHDSLLNPTELSLYKLYISNALPAMKPWLPTPPRKTSKDLEALVLRTSLSRSQDCLLACH